MNILGNIFISCAFEGRMVIGKGDYYYLAKREQFTAHFLVIQFVFVIHKFQ